MVASIDVELSYYGGLGRRRRRGFDALAQLIGRAQIPFRRKYFVPVARRRIGADILEFAVPEIADVISSKKTSNQLLKTWHAKL